VLLVGMMKHELTLQRLLEEARTFAHVESRHPEPSLFGVTDGKAVGTYFEHKFQAYLGQKYEYQRGSSAKGIDFPALHVDVKVTSIKQPQSSCPFRSARQKIFGLGYSLLVFVYQKTDDPATSTGILDVLHTVFVEAERSADYQMTRGIRELLERDANEDDLVAFMQDRLLPVDDIAVREIAREILQHPPALGYLTISNALQWRLQYKRVIEEAGKVEGIVRVR
jgi:hypothetical protein